MKRLMILCVVALIVPATAATPAAKYTRSPAVLKDSAGKYWLAYTQAVNTGDLSDFNDLAEWHEAADTDDYNIYFKKADSVPALLDAPAKRVSAQMPQDGYVPQYREVALAELNGKVYLFGSEARRADGTLRVYYYVTADGGETWAGPVEAAALAAHALIHATTANLDGTEKIYLSASDMTKWDPMISTWSFDGTEFGKPLRLPGYHGHAEAIDNALHITAVPRGAKEIKITTTADNVHLGVSESVLQGSTDHHYDTVVGKCGDEYLVLSAPTDETDTQWVEMRTAASLKGPWTALALTAPPTGYWDYWPDVLVDDGAAYVFYTCEDGGTGHIALLEVPETATLGSALALAAGCVLLLRQIKRARGHGLTSWVSSGGA